ncbi:MAG: oligosaccharide flippase family protein [Nitrospinota bacterium]|nr:oligosaccharide flippase family protein [Nitrospinota bacterium]
MKKKLIKNTLISTAETLLTHPVILILTGYMINRLGQDVYGIISFVSIFSVIGYASLLDFGIQGGLVVYISEYLAEGKTEKIGRLASSALMFFAGIGSFLFLLVAYISASEALYIFKFNKEYEEPVRLFLLLGAAQLFFQFPGLLVSSFFEGYQRYDILKGGSALYKLFSYGLIFLVVFMEYDYIYIAWALLATSILHFIAMLAMTRHLPGLKLGISLWDFDELKKVFNLSKKLFVFRLAGLVFNQTDKILISLFLGIALLTDYEVIIRFTSIVFAFLAFLNSAVVPAASELSSNSDTARLKELFFAGTRYSIILTIALVTPIVAFAKPIISFWVGAEYLILTPYMQFFTMHMLVSAVSGFGVTMLVGMKKVDHVMGVAAAAMAINLLVSLSLIKVFGIYGLLLGTVAGFFLSAVPYAWIFRKEFDIPFQHLFSELGRKVYIPGLLFFVVVNFAVYRFGGDVGEMSLLNLSLSTALVGLIFLAWAWYFMFTRGDRRLLADFAGRFAKPGGATA